jgi:hypothetical protein
MEQDHEKHPQSVNNFYGSINNYNVYQSPVTYEGQVNNYSNKAEEESRDDMPSQEQFVRAVEATAQRGMWWSSRSWAVAYRVYQMLGYPSSISQFIRDAVKWRINTGFECSYDAVQKPIAQGLLMGDTDKWEINGAKKQAVILGDALLEELKIQRKTPFEKIEF